MENQPLVSVLIISYNHEKFIEQTLKSIINQTYKNIQLIVIDDGSTDKSFDIIKKNGNQYNFHFETHQNMGLIDTLNKGIELCKGDYIGMVAGDDFWMLDKIEKQLNYMIENDCDICCGNVLNISETDELLPIYFQKIQKSILYDFHNIITFNYYIPSLTVLYNKKIFMNFNYNKDYSIEDYFMFMSATFKGYKIHFMNDILAFYRIHQNNMSKKNKFMRDEKLKIINMYKNEKGYYVGLLKTYIKYYTHLILSIVPSKLFPFKRS